MQLQRSSGNNKKMHLITRILITDTYETIDIANEPTYHYADREEVVGQRTKPQPIYNVLEEPGNPQQDNTYSILVKQEKHENESMNGKEVPLYNVLNRDQLR